ncbi:unnamed protein product [Camellia sinensis]
MVFASFWYSGIFRRLFCTDSLPTSPSDLITSPTTAIPTTTTFENPKKDFKTQVKTPGLVARFMGLGSFPNPGSESKIGNNKKSRNNKKVQQAVRVFDLLHHSLSPHHESTLAVAKITGDEWNNMTKKQKKPYEKIAKKNKEKYLEEMGAYKQRNEEESANLKKEEDELMKNSQARSLAIAQEEREN